LTKISQGCEKIKKNNILQVCLDDKLAKKIDDARGLAKASTYVRDLLEKHFENNTTQALN